MRLHFLSQRNSFGWVRTRAWQASTDYESDALPTLLVLNIVNWLMLIQESNFKTIINVTITFTHFVLGSKERQEPSSTRVPYFQTTFKPRVNLPDICSNGTIDAITRTDSGVTYIFKGNWRAWMFLVGSTHATLMLHVICYITLSTQYSLIRGTIDITSLIMITLNICVCSYFRWVLLQTKRSRYRKRLSTSNRRRLGNSNRSHRRSSYMA